MPRSVPVTSWRKREELVNRRALRLALDNTNRYLSMPSSSSRTRSRVFAIFLPFIGYNPADLVFFQGIRIFKFQERVRAPPPQQSRRARLQHELARFARVIHYSPSASARFVRAGDGSERGRVIFCIKVREIIQCRSSARFSTPRVRVAAKNASFAFPLLALLITHDGETSFLPTHDLCVIPPDVMRVLLHFRLRRLSR